MICTETGVLENSHYFFFTPSPITKDFYYYMLVNGHFYCESGYSIKRGGGVAPMIFYIVNGQLHFKYEKKKYTAQKGHIVLIDCNKPHEYFCQDHCEFLFFHFNGLNAYPLTNHLIEQNHSILFHLENKKQICSLMNEMTNKLILKEPVSEMEISMCVYNTICSVQTFNEITHAPSSTVTHTMNPVIKYIRDNISQEFTLDSLASQVNLSKYYFARAFRQEFGVPPMEYIAQMKISLAQTMLTTTDRTIADIAISLGFSSSSSFINAFTSRTGISPGKYRKYILPDN